MIFRVLLILFLTGCISKDVSFVAADGTQQKTIYRPGNNILIVELHSWNADRFGVYEWNGLSLEEASRKEGWAYVRPEARGPNNSPESCCSPLVISDIDKAIEYAVERNKIKKVVLAGVSGGGYTALCYLSKGKHKPDLASVWNPISDLEDWLIEKKGTHYEPSIRACGDLKSRSPINMPFPEVRLDLYAGNNDERVFPSHATKYYNRKNVCKPQKHDPLEGVGVLKYCPGKISFYLFDGGHEMIVPHVINSIKDEIKP